MRFTSALRWSLPGVLLLSAILIPFFLYEQEITAWTEDRLSTQSGRWAAGVTIASLLASDILLPVPSSLVATAAGYLLGWWRGTLAAWAGLMAGCGFGYLLGASVGRSITRRLVGDEELIRAAHAYHRLGPWTIVVFRAVPVLAEASILYAGTVSMPRARFWALASLSNLGVAVTYASVGAFSLEVESFLLAFAGAIAIPGAAMAAAHLTKRRS